MPTLRDLIDLLQARADVSGVVLLGRDGLLVDAGGLTRDDAEHLAAVVPAVVGAGDAIGLAADAGALQTAILEFAGGLAVVSVLSADVALVVRIARDADPGPLVYELRRSRTRFAALA